MPTHVSPWGRVVSNARITRLFGSYMVYTNHPRSGVHLPFRLSFQWFCLLALVHQEAQNTWIQKVMWPRFVGMK